MMPNLLNLDPVNSKAFHDEPQYSRFFNLVQFLALLFRSAIACSPKQGPGVDLHFPAVSNLLS